MPMHRDVHTASHSHYKSVFARLHAGRTGVQTAAAEQKQDHRQPPLPRTGFGKRRPAKKEDRKPSNSAYHRPRPPAALLATKASAPVVDRTNMEVAAVAPRVTEDGLKTTAALSGNPLDVKVIGTNILFSGATVTAQSPCCPAVIVTVGVTVRVKSGAK